ncbi:MAG TPA: CPBP family intramembrane metalloprotease [Firmicutes bacterium]|nr:CPBP family intramembrane metalloprotease [Bacillota bacterium]
MLFFFAFLLGLYLGYLYKITGAIWTSIGFHISFNYFASVLDIPEGIPFYIVMAMVLILNFVLMESCYAKRRDKNLG